MDRGACPPPIWPAGERRHEETDRRTRRNNDGWGGIKGANGTYPLELPIALSCDVDGNGRLEDGGDPGGGG